LWDQYPFRLGEFAGAANAHHFENQRSPGAYRINAHLSMSVRREFKDDKFGVWRWRPYPPKSFHMENREFADRQVPEAAKLSSKSHPKRTV
jgi:hypothetical protein